MKDLVLRLFCIRMGRLLGEEANSPQVTNFYVPFRGALNLSNTLENVSVCFWEKKSCERNTPSLHKILMYRLFPKFTSISISTQEGLFSKLGSIRLQRVSCIITINTKWLYTGLVTDSNLFCWLFKIQDQYLKVCFYKHTSLQKSFYGVLGSPPSVACNTPNGVLVTLEFY